MKRWLIAAALLLLVALPTCDEPFSVDPPNGFDQMLLELGDWPDTLLAGASGTLDATLTLDGDTVDWPPLLWKSTDPGILRVRVRDDTTRNGAYQAFRPGQVDVEVRIDGKNSIYPDTSASRSLSVFLDGVELLPAVDTTLTALGDTTLVWGRAMGIDDWVVANAGLRWQGGGSAIDTLSLNGDSLWAVAVRQGTDTLMIRHDACLTPCADTLVVTVDQVPVQVRASVQDVRFDALGVDTALTAAVQDRRGNAIADDTVTWSLAAGGETVVSVTSDGTLTSLANGEAEVIAAAGEMADTVNVVVEQAVASVVVTPDGVVFAVGDSTQLTATVTDANGSDVTDAELTWTSGGAAVSVDADGWIRALSVDTVDVIAAAEDVEDTVVVAVVPDVAGDVNHDGKVGICDLDAVLNAYGTYTPPPYRAEDLDQDGDVDAADKDTVLTHWGGGESLVVVTPPTAAVAGDPMATVEAEVQDADGPVTCYTGPVRVEIGVNPASGALSGSLEPAAVDGRATYDDLVIDAVGSGYTLQFLAQAGTDSVIYQAETGTFDVLSDSVATVAVSPDSAQLPFLGDTVRFAAEPRNAAGDPVTGATVSWSSDATAVATVDNAGLATAVAEGVTGISATAVGVTGTATAVVDQVVDSLALAPDSVHFNALQDTARIAVAAFDSGGSDVAEPGLVWTSSNDGVATADAAVITATGNGTAQVTASADGVSRAVTVTVDQVPVELAVEPQFLAIDVGAADTVAAEVRDSNGVVIAGAPVSWTSAADSIATVDSTGVITGVAAGVTTVTATSGTLTAHVDVTVALPGLVDDPLAVAESGAYFSCDINYSSSINCWGENRFGQLGDGTSNHRAYPNDIDGGRAFASVSAGDEHACGVTLEGEAYCWGRGNDGQLGNGNYNDQSSPVLVSGGHTFKQVSLGHSFSCGLTTAGDAYCWGADGQGRLGDGGGEQTSATPVPVAGGHTFDRIDAGDSHACGLNTAGELYCWGHNGSGRLGDGTWNDQSSPSLVSGGYSWAYVSAGAQSTCGLTTSGVAYCWGDNNDYRLGHESGNQGEPGIAVSGALTYKAIAAGDAHTCGITTDDLTVCWGRNHDGQLGIGRNGPGQTSSPQLVETSETFEHIDAGSRHTCAMNASGATWCWGHRGANGAIGDGLLGQYNEPYDVQTGITIADGGLGDPVSHVCHIGTDGKTYCAGENGNGELGDGSSTDRASLAPVSTDQTFVQVEVANWSHTCALTSAGDAYCWGANGSGQLGNGEWTDPHVPVLVSGGLTWQDIAAGRSGQTCAATTDGALYCWGANWSSQAGQDDTGQNYNTPQLVDDSRSYVDVEAGDQYSCALTDGGDVYCWGDDNQCVGVLGDGTWCNQRSTPVLVQGGHTFTALSVGEDRHACAITGSGEGYCWGRNGNGQLGDGTNDNRNAPVRAGLILFSHIDAGSNHTCGSKTDGSEVCWGGGGTGDLGNGTWNDSNTPVLVTGGVDFTAIRAGEATTCGVTSGGSLYCWGTRGNGVFGDGAYENAWAPRHVTPH